MNNTDGDYVKEEKHIIENIAYISLAVISLFSNLSVLFVCSILERRGSLQPVGLILCSVAFSCLLFGLIVVPVQALGDASIFKFRMCPVVLAATIVYVSSIVFVLLLAFTELYLSLRRQIDEEAVGARRPLVASDKRTLLLSWIASGVLGLLSGFTSHSRDSPVCIMYRHAPNTLVFFFVICIVCLPLLAMLLVNVLLHRLAIKRCCVVAVYGSKPEHRATIMSDLQVSRTVASIFQAAFLSWIPFAVLLLVAVDREPELTSGSAYYILVKICQFIFSASCLVVPARIVITSSPVRMYVADFWKSCLQKYCSGYISRPETISLERREESATPHQ